MLLAINNGAILQLSNHINYHNFYDYVGNEVKNASHFTGPEVDAFLPERRDFVSVPNLYGFCTECMKLNERLRLPH